MSESSPITKGQLRLHAQRVAAVIAELAETTAGALEEAIERSSGGNENIGANYETVDFDVDPENGDDSSESGPFGTLDAAFAKIPSVGDKAYCINLRGTITVSSVPIVEEKNVPSITIQGIPNETGGLPYIHTSQQIASGLIIRNCPGRIVVKNIIFDGDYTTSIMTLKNCGPCVLESISSEIIEGAIDLKIANIPLVTIKGCRLTCSVNGNVYVNDANVIAINNELGGKVAEWGVSYNPRTGEETKTLFAFYDTEEGTFFITNGTVFSINNTYNGDPYKSANCSNYNYYSADGQDVDSDFDFEPFLKHVALPIASSSVLGGVKVGTNISVNSAGTISVANGTTSAKGVVQLNNTVTSTSTTVAATANAVKTAYDMGKGTVSLAASGYVKLGNGLRMQWGTVSASSSTAGSATLSGFSAIYNIQLTPAAAAVIPYIASSSTTALSIKTNNATARTIHWRVLGKGS